jgi:hypothetical protein
MILITYSIEPKQFEAMSFSSIANTKDEKDCTIMREADYLPSLAGVL